MPRHFQYPAVTLDNQLQYQFLLDGGRTNQLLTFVNNGPSALTLQSVQVTTNAYIGSGWQLFGNQWVNVQVTENDDAYTYTLTFTQPVQIPPGVTKVLEYSVDQNKNKGIYSQVAMPPKQINVQLEGSSSWRTVSYNAPNPQPNPFPTMRYAVYQAQWDEYFYKRNTTTEPWQDINSLTYCFNGFDVNGNVFSLDAWADQFELPLLALQKQANPYLDFSLSFGGWTNNNQRMDTVFSEMAANNNARSKFINNVLSAIEQTGANAIDIDWEYVEANDVENFIALLTELKSSMPKGCRLTIAAPSGIDKIDVFTSEQWQLVGAVVDEIRVMAYDFFGGFSQYSDFHAAWQLSPNSPNYKTSYDTLTALKTYQQKMDVPASKLSLGIPNYARAVIVDNLGDYAGLYQPVTGTPQGDFPGANGVYSWNNIYNLLNQQPSALDQLGVKQWQYYNASHPLCQDAKMGLLTGQLPTGQWVVLNFLDQASATWRAQYAKQAGFAGVMMWADYFDTPKVENSIAHAIATGLRASKVQLDAKAAVNQHSEKLRDAYLIGKKRDALAELIIANKPAEMEKLLHDKRAELGKHRNIIKRFFSAILPNAVAEFLFGKPKSLVLAEKMVAAWRENFAEPTRIIPGKNSRSNNNYSAITHGLAKQYPCASTLPIYTCDQPPSYERACAQQNLPAPSAPPLNTNYPGQAVGTARNGFFQPASAVLPHLPSYPALPQAFQPRPFKH